MDAAIQMVTLDEPPRALPLLARAALRRSGSDRPLPARGYRVMLSGADRSNLTAYQRICGFGIDDRLPVTYPHVLGFPLQALLMSSGDFPLPMAGLVHIENTITAMRPLDADESIELSVRPGRLRPHPKGRTVELLTEASVDGQTAWTGCSTYLARESPPSDVDDVEASRRPAVPAGPPAQVWRLPGDLGRRYAAVSGDVNPFHLHAIPARAMGFRRAIAHGMWTYAATLAALGGRAAYAGTNHVWFTKPVFIPGSVALVAGETVSGRTAALVSPTHPDRTHLILTAKDPS